jgi:hypothetical protein
MTLPKNIVFINELGRFYNRWIVKVTSIFTGVSGNRAKLHAGEKYLRST